MRIGANPKKEDSSLAPYPLHRIILPVFIPETQGYFAEALEVLKVCLESLRLAKKPETAVTIVANGCCEPARALLLAEQQRGWLDQLLLNQQNRGKTDAIVGAARASFEPMVTFSDSDVRFRRGWDTAVETLFRTFPECGFVSPFPNPGAELWHSSATFLAGICQRTLAFRKITDHADIDAFHKSLGRPDCPHNPDRLGHVVVARAGVTACLGAGHFVCSLRREVIRAMPAHPALEALAPTSDLNWLDLPPDRLGCWKLSTSEAFVQHLGNRLEPWMSQALAASALSPIVATAPAPPLPALRLHWTALLPYPVRRRLGCFLARKLRDKFRQAALRP
jgi:hypothetical protein